MNNVFTDVFLALCAHSALLFIIQFSINRATAKDRAEILKKILSETKDKK